MEDSGQPRRASSRGSNVFAPSPRKNAGAILRLGRACARAALANLGQGEAVIGIDEAGAPLWPAGVVGSITHTKGYAAALVAKARFSGSAWMRNGWAG